MAQQSKAAVKEASDDLLVEIRTLHMGTPRGPGRVQALSAAGHPFAAWRGVSLWPTPPIGIISGNLLASLSVMESFGSNQYTLTAKSTGVSYAQFLYSPTGTSKMVPRHLIEAANDYSEWRVLKLGRDLMQYQLQLL